MTLYEDSAVFVLYATEEDVKKRKTFDVEDNEFWNHKIHPEKILERVISIPKPKKEEVKK